MRLSATKSKSPARALSISLELQRWVVGGLAAMALVQVGFVVTMYGFDSGSASYEFVLSSFAFTMFPLIVFALAFFTTPFYPEKINRWFVAALKTLVVAAIFGALQSLKGYVFIMLTNHGSGQSGAMPSPWVTSMISDYVILAVCMVGFVYSIYRGRKK